jgi:hypothetical protein
LRNEAAEKVSVVIPVIFGVLGVVGESIRPGLVVLHGRQEDLSNLVHVFLLGESHLRLEHGDSRKGSVFV